MTMMGMMVVVRKGCTPPQIHVAYAGPWRKKLVAYCSRPFSDIITCGVEILVKQETLFGFQGRTRRAFEK